MNDITNSISPELSVIIVNWNTKDLLIQSINEIKKNNYNIPIEIIVVDNASTDGSVEKLKLIHPDVILIQNSINKGFAHANNQGYCISKGKYICLMNTDVELSDGCFLKLYKFMEENKNVGMSGPKVYNKNKTIQKTCWRFETPTKLFAISIYLHHIFPDIISYKTDKEKKVDYLAGCFWFIRRDTIEKVGFLDERFFFYGEDKDWCYRCHQNGWDIVLKPDVSIVHYGGSSSSTAPIRYFIQQERALLQFISKHYSIYEQIICYSERLLYYIIRIICHIAIGIPSGKISKLPKQIACFKWLILLKPISEKIILIKQNI